MWYITFMSNEPRHCYRVIWIFPCTSVYVGDYHVVATCVRPYTFHTCSCFSSALNQPPDPSQIHMKRRSVLYVVNFMLPILFFLGLDLASFLISDSSGEKLGFKVTVLLAVTVMQLILNEILPSSSDRIPLIGKVAQSHWTSYEPEQHMLNQCVVICPH